MRLVVELDDLVVVGKAVAESPPAFAAVERLIASSPSLTDVMGAAADDLPPESVADRLLEVLTEEWQTTQELRDAVDSTGTTVLNHLARLEEAGRVERRRGNGRSFAWRLV